MSVRIWLRDYGTATFTSHDFHAGLVATLGCFLVFLETPPADYGDTLALAIAGLGFAVVGTVLGSLSILVGMLDDSYRQVLAKTRLGVRGALMPYTTTAIVGGLAMLAGLVAFPLAVADPKGAWPEALSLSIAVGCGVWAAVGTVQLVLLTARTADRRARWIEGMDAVRVLRDQRRASG